MSEDFVVPTSGAVEYQYFDVPTNFTEDKWVQAMEIMPGAREAVHHVMLYAKAPPAPGAATPAGTPAPQPLFVRTRAPPARADSSCFTCSPPVVLGTLIGTAVPGSHVVEFPKGTALTLRVCTVA